MSRELARLRRLVEENLDNPKVVLVEVDEDTTAYDKGHIKGAIKLDWTTDLQDQVRRDFVSKAQFEALLSDRGVANDDTVVRTAATTTGSPPTPTGTSSSTATRTSSCSTAVARSGSSTRASWSASCRAARQRRTPPRSRTSPSVPSATRPSPPSAPRTWSTDVPDEFAGRLLGPGAPPAGAGTARAPHPDRGQRPVEQAANDDGTFPFDDELKEIYSEAVDWSKDTIAYCRIGERSSHTWFVLKEILGQENVKNYDGSWTEYGSLVGVPIALGDEPGEA